MFTQKFQSYVCPGDSITCDVDGFTVRATIHFDTDSNVSDADCYSQENIDAWLREEWFFCGVVLSVEREDVTLSDHASSLWAVEANLGDASSAYLGDLANEMIEDALDVARDALRRVCACEHA